jgi:hypothetical protein
MLATLILSACTTDNKEADINLSDELKNVQSELDAVKERLVDFVVENQLKEEEKQKEETFKSIAIFRSNTTESASITTNDGHLFVVALIKLTKYANGYKATFNIGNPSLLTYNGLKAKVFWGAAGDVKSHEIIISKSILPGVWNVVDVVLSPAKENDIAVVWLSLTVAGYSLQNDLRREKN